MSTSQSPAAALRPSAPTATPPRSDWHALSLTEQDREATKLLVALAFDAKVAPCDSWRQQVLLHAVAAIGVRLQQPVGSAHRAPGPWTPVSLLRKAGERTARLCVNRLVYKTGVPSSEYMRDGAGDVLTFATIDEARAAIGEATGAAA
jgi:hypothetical protein